MAMGDEEDNGLWWSCSLHEHLGRVPCGICELEERCRYQCQGCGNKFTGPPGPIQCNCKRGEYVKWLNSPR